MKIRFTKHFEERMVERGIDIDHVKRAIRNPDKKIKHLDNSYVVTKKINGKTIEVVYFLLGYIEPKYILETAYYI